MVNQTLISFKVNSDNLQRFDLLCDSLGIKRNKMLNFLVEYCLYQMNDVSKFGILLAYSKALTSLDV